MPAACAGDVRDSLLARIEAATRGRIYATCPEPYPA
jgi:hypothetical protein